MTQRRRTAAWFIAAAITTMLVLASAMAADGSGGTQATNPPCSSPRQALRTLLHWQTEGSVDTVHASACISRKEMEDPANDAPAMAMQLKKVLDGRGLHITLEDVPDDPDYKDALGQFNYNVAPERLGGVLLARDGQKWLFPPSSLERVTELYLEIYPMDLAAMVRTAPAWLRIEVAGIAVWQVLGILLVIVLAILMQRLVIILVSTGLHRLARHLGHEWAREVAQRAAPPLGGLAMATAFTFGLPLMHFPGEFNRVGLFGARVLAAASLVWLGYRMVDVLAEQLARKAALTDTKLDDQLVPIARKIMKVIIVLVGGVFILHNLDVNVGSLLAGLGLGGAALAFAAKDSLAHVFGSLMIFMDKPFQIGDYIKVGGDVEGTVEEVGFRSTRVRTPQDSLLTVPNAKMAESVVDNLGLRKHRRYRTVLALTYNTPPQLMGEFCLGLRSLLEASPRVAHERSLVEFHDFGDCSLSVMLNCFIEADDWPTEMSVRAELNLAILVLADKVGVRFAFPTRTIHVASMPSDVGQPT